MFFTFNAEAQANAKALECFVNCGIMRYATWLVTQCLLIEHRVINQIANEAQHHGLLASLDPVANQDQTLKYILI